MEPYSLRPFLQKAVSRTRAFQTNPDAKVEIHTVLRETDVCYYLLALKSLLRFIDDFRVVVHDDGSLTEEDGRMLRNHFEGIEILGRREMDEAVERRLGGRRCALECRRTRPIFFQAIDYFTSAKAERIISLDSDTLFFEFPQELADWMRSGQESVRYAFEVCAGLHLLDEAGNYHFADKSFPFPLVNGINGGLVCCPAGMADYDLLESYLRHVKATFGMRPGQRVHAQNVYGLYLLKAGIPHDAFSRQRYKVLCHYTSIELHNKFREPAVFKHYNHRPQRFDRAYRYAEDIQGVADELMRKYPG